jgi:acetolactate synthase-1/3 small subunit
VVKVSELTDRKHVERELLLVKVATVNGTARTEVKRITDIFRGSIVDIGKQIYTIELTGSSEKLNAFIETLSNETEIIESVRSGCVGIARGEKAMRV